MVYICPRCQQRFPAAKGTIDYVHECNSGDTTLDEEDVPVVGEWTDYTGSGDDGRINLKGSENELWGERSAIEGETDHEVTERGNTKSTHRTRKHLEFIKLK